TCVLFSCRRFYIFIELRVDAAAASIRHDVNALYPPEPSVSPVAPFKCDHQAAERTTVFLGDQITHFLWIGHDNLDTLAELFGRQLFALGLKRHRFVKADQ